MLTEEKPVRRINAIERSLFMAWFGESFVGHIAFLHLLREWMDMSRLLHFFKSVIWYMYRKHKITRSILTSRWEDFSDFEFLLFEFEEAERMFVLYGDVYDSKDVYSWIEVKDSDNFTKPTSDCAVILKEIKERKWKMYFFLR